MDCGWGGMWTCCGPLKHGGCGWSGKGVIGACVVDSGGLGTENASSRFCARLVQSLAFSLCLKDGAAAFCTFMSLTGGPLKEDPFPGPLRSAQAIIRLSSACCGFPFCAICSKTFVET